MDQGKINKILVIRIDFLGDMVCTTPLLHSLRRRWPQAEIHVLANKYNAPVLDNNSDVDKIHYYIYSKNYHKNPRPGFFNALIDRLSLIITLRRLKFDLLIIPNGGMSRSAIRFAKLLSVPDCRWHTADTEFDDRVQSHIDSRIIEHEAFSGFNLLPELVKPEPDQLRLRVYPRTDIITLWRRRLKNRAKPKIGFFVSNNSLNRRWSWDKWQALTETLSETYEIIFFVSPQDHFSFSWMSGDDVQRVSTETVSDLVAAMTHLDLIVSADSAPVHFASALQIPVVALFESRPEKYQRWYPLGVKHILLHQGKRVEDISVESVSSAVEELVSQIHTNAGWQKGTKKFGNLK